MAYAAQPAYAAPYAPPPMYAAQPPPVAPVALPAAPVAAPVSVNPTTIVNQAPAASPVVVVAPSAAPAPTVQNQYPFGSCRYCGGQFENRFTCCGWVWCVVCFPIGIICLFTEREKRCSSCDRKP